MLTPHLRLDYFDQPAVTLPEQHLHRIFVVRHRQYGQQQPAPMRGQHIYMKFFQQQQLHASPKHWQNQIHQLSGSSPHSTSDGKLMPLLLK